MCVWNKDQQKGNTYLWKFKRVKTEILVRIKKYSDDFKMKGDF